MCPLGTLALICAEGKNLNGREDSMNQNRGNYRRVTYDKNRRVQSGRNRSEYVYGNTVRKLEPQRPQRHWVEAPVKKVSPVVRKNREKAHHMSAGYVLFLAVALCAAAYILVNYIQLQARLTNLTKSVANKKSELNVLTLSNDEEYNRIISGIDLEEIKRIAIGELGMVYAQEGQIIEYENESKDYMRKVLENN